MMIKVYATHETALIWYTHPPNCESYYVRTVKKCELKDGVYLNVNF